MLVNTHKLILLLVLFVGISSVQAQEIWTLKQSIDTAQVKNKTLLINKNNIGISEQKQKEVVANLIPKISANADYKYFMELPTQLMPMNALNPAAPDGQFRDMQFGVPHNINANVQMVLPLYNSQIYGAIGNTKIANELAKLQYQKTEEQVIYDITTLYYNAQILKNQLDFISSNLVNSNKLLQSMQLMKDQLLVKETDVNKVRLQTDQLETQKDAIYSNYVQVLNALKLNIGLPLQKDITVELEILQPAPKNMAPRKSLDLRILNSQKSLINNEIKTLNYSRFLPSLNLIVSYGTTGFGYDKKPNNFLDFYPIGFAGVQMSFDLFNGTVTQRKINQKRLEINNNELQTQLITDKTEMEISNANSKKSIAQSAIANTKNQIDLADSIYEQTVLLQKQGEANLTEILLADNALREAQQNYLGAIIDYLKADLEFKKLTGTIIE